MTPTDIPALKALEREQQARADALQREASKAQRAADQTRKQIKRLRRAGGDG